jgi:type IV pilus assembly PilX-like protein
MNILNQKIVQTMPSQQSGAALFISLIMLMALTIIGLSAANRSNLQERMASNFHIQNVAFNAAESAIGGFVVDSFTGNKLDPAHVLYNLRISGSLNNKCYDSDGNRLDCGGVYLDGDRSGVITSELNVAVIQDCNPRACGGFSIGNSSSGGIGCRVYQIDGTGTVGNKSESSSLWAYEVTACSK